METHTNKIQHLSYVHSTLERIRSSSNYYLSLQQTLKASLSNWRGSRSYGISIVDFGSGGYEGILPYYNYFKSTQCIDNYYMVDNASLDQCTRKLRNLDNRTTFEHIKLDLNAIDWRCIPFADICILSHSLYYVDDWIKLLDTIIENNHQLVLIVARDREGYLYNLKKRLKVKTGIYSDNIFKYLDEKRVSYQSIKIQNRVRIRPHSPTTKNKNSCSTHDIVNFYFKSLTSKKRSYIENVISQDLFLSRKNNAGFIDESDSIIFIINDQGSHNT